MNKKTSSQLLLASASPRRVELLKQINITADIVEASDINETPLKHERPCDLALRLSLEKARVQKEKHPDYFILAADTVVACGAQIQDKAENEKSARTYLSKLSGRRHHVHGGITLITPAGRELSVSVKTQVQFKPLSPQEIDDYIASNEWDGKAGGYAIQGFAASFVKNMQGSYSNVVGLSLYDTMRILKRGKYL